MSTTYYECECGAKFSQQGAVAMCRQNGHGSAGRAAAGAVADALALRDYFAAHAPAERWPHFRPVLPPAPVWPPIDPVGNDGEAPSDELNRVFKNWLLEDPGCCDPDEDAPPDAEVRRFADWIQLWRRYWREQAAWTEQRAIEAIEQWPYFYADTMLKRRGA